MVSVGTPWAAITQCTVAGLIAGLCMLHAVWGQSEQRRRTGRWMTWWSAVLAVLFLLNGISSVSASLPLTEVVLFLRSLVLAGAVVLAVPSIQVFTNGPSARPVLWITGAVYAVRAVLWLTTDLVFAHSYNADQVPQYGPLVTVTFLVPVAVVIVYAAVSIRRMPSIKLRALLTLAGGMSVLLLVLAFVATNLRLGELLTSVWTLPLVALLQLMAMRDIWVGQQTERRLARIRADQVTLSNAVWFQREPQAMLAQAEQMARTLLEDDELTGTVRRLARGNHVVGLYPSPTTAVDAIDLEYLDALARIVTAAADQHAMAADMRRAAMTDPLTKLPNRPALEAHLRGVLATADEKSSRLAVIFCDVDDFKKVNDEHGHPRGDAILVEAAGRFKEIVGDGSYVARFGGDEFVVVMEDAGPDADLLAIARTLRTALAPNVPGGPQAPTFSVGVALWTPGEDRDPFRLLRDADTAMYGAKTNRDGILLFDPSLRERLLSEIEQQSALSRGVAAGEIEAVFQPVVEGTSRSVLSYEALARWRRDGSLRPPAEWLPLAEKSGLIIEVGLEILRQARLHSDATGLPVAVNVSPRQLAEPSFVADVVEAWGGDAWDRLILEITESALVDDVLIADEMLTELRSLGVRVALDDFGTGYSSIALLGGLPIDVLKIDRAFVTAVLSPRGRAVVRAILALADAYGLDVIAEGVELEEELGVLNDLGPMHIQGFLTGRPAAAADLTGQAKTA